MNLRKKIGGIFAFSLAEALITLLIVAIITVASIPVITRKHREKSAPHGAWMCTLNANGRAMYYSKDTPAWKETGGTSCTFTPPPGTRNFEFTIIGGGGSGGSGNTRKEDFILTDGGTRSFVAPGNGSYKIYLIGGGGNGGNRKNNANRCQENPGGPGSSGGFKYSILNLVKDRNYYIKAGNAGRGSNDRGGDDGTESYIKDLATGHILAQATGGKGGQSRRGSACGKRKEDGNKFIRGGKCGNNGCPGNPGSPSGVTGWTLGGEGDRDSKYSVPGHLCSSTISALSGTVGGVSCRDLLKDVLNASSREYDYGYQGGNNYIGTRYGLPYGYGGKGQSTGQTSGPTEGGAGFVRFQYYLVTSGDGGKAGEVNRPPVVASLKKATAYPGRGASTTSIINTDGYRGNTTTCVIEAKDHTSQKIAMGGEGGKAEADRRASAEVSDVILGKIGDTSPVKLLKIAATGGLGGFMNGNTTADGQTVPKGDRNYFGAGGGGGGANSDVWGKGGAGGAGAVIIEW